MMPLHDALHPSDRLVTPAAITAIGAAPRPTAAAESAAPLTVETIADYADFLRMESLWNRLNDESGIDHPFLTHEWIRSWWESFGRANHLHLLLVRAGDRPIGLAPLMQNRTMLYGLPVRRLQLIRNDHTPRSGFLIADRHDEVCRTLWRHLADRARWWDVLQLGQLPHDSIVRQEVARLAAGDDFLCNHWPASASPCVRISGAWDRYFASRHTRHQRNVLHRLQRLSRTGRVDMAAITAAVDVPAAFADGLRIEGAAWKAAAGTAMSSDTRVRDFYSRLALRASTRGWLELQFLRVGDCPIAFGYALNYRSRMYLLKAGYMPSHARYSPVHLLVHQTLRRAFDDALCGFDFLGEDEPWKRLWADDTQHHEWLFVCPPRMRMRLLHGVKFRLAPRLRQHAAYRWMRNAFLTRPITSPGPGGA
jgi:CelD/BcsL family acetyltransferase involved in cellulose biosynthesis